MPPPVLLWISPAQRLFLFPLFRAWLYCADQEVSHITALFESHGNTPGRPGCPRVYTHPSTVFLHTRYLTRLPSKATDIVVRDHANSVMPQRLAADQHSSLVQLLARFILAASVDVALISFSGPLIHPVKWNFADLSRMSFVDGNCIIRAVTVNVRALVNELPDLFIGLRVLHRLVLCHTTSPRLSPRPESSKQIDPGQLVPAATR